jgi:hypothetical protein
VSSVAPVVVECGVGESAFLVVFVFGAGAVELPCAQVAEQDGSCDEGGFPSPGEVWIGEGEDAGGDYGEADESKCVAVQSGSGWRA